MLRFWGIGGRRDTRSVMPACSGGARRNLDRPGLQGLACLARRSLASRRRRSDDAGAVGRGTAWLFPEKSIQCPVVSGSHRSRGKSRQLNGQDSIGVVWKLRSGNRSCTSPPGTFAGFGIPLIRRMSIEKETNPSVCMVSRVGRLL